MSAVPCYILALFRRISLNIHSMNPSRANDKIQHTDTHTKKDRVVTDFTIVNLRKRRDKKETRAYKILILLLVGK